MQMWEIIEENQLAQNVENFPIANLRRRNGEIGTQGVSSSQIADILINVAGLNVSRDMNMRELVGALKANPPEIILYLTTAGIVSSPNKLIKKALWCPSLR